VEPRFVEAISDNRIPFLQRGTVDLILSTMTINQERDLEIEFSEPYYIARGRILVPQDSDIGGLEDLAGNRVCTALGSTYEETIREEAPEADLRLVDTYSECLELLQNGAIDAISTDDVILTGMIIQDDTLQMVGDELTVEPYGAGIKEGDREFQQFVSDTLEAAQADGRWEDIYQEWVGQYVDQDAQPPDMTLEEALALG
jgi:glutamate transport system substrate-binding protein